jgi:hypothetical protein
MEQLQLHQTHIILVIYVVEDNHIFLPWTHIIITNPTGFHNNHLLVLL